MLEQNKISNNIYHYVFYRKPVENFTRLLVIRLGQLTRWCVFRCYRPVGFVLKIRLYLVYMTTTTDRVACMRWLLLSVDRCDEYRRFCHKNRNGRETPIIFRIRIASTTGRRAARTNIWSPRFSTGCPAYPMHVRKYKHSSRPIGGAH